MKNLKVLLLTMALAFTTTLSFVNAQEEESESPFSVGADLVSSYVWRGVKYGGPALQPYVEYGIGGFAVGAWGSFGIGPLDEAVNEADLYLGYGFDFGLYLGITDYYYQGTPYFQTSGDTSSHALELNGAYEIGGFSIAANYIINDARNGAGSQGGDLYFEAGYSFKHFDVFVGAGNGWHSTFEDNGDDKFAVVNIGISASKEIKLSDSFSLPVGGLVSLNPDSEEFNIVATISF
ncbi:MAG TPA: hypothetical protein DDX98_02540 [Bacteroidales bacterium]|nr:hypothetical protein [Bacteroidales bacterium]